jgi:hypothetical protein
MEAQRQLHSGYAPQNEGGARQRTARAEQDDCAFIRLLDEGGGVGRHAHHMFGAVQDPGQAARWFSRSGCAKPTLGAQITIALGWHRLRQRD